jgi:hypothetical protein
MEPEGSLPHSQVPATCPYPEDPAHTPTPLFLKIHLNIIFPSTPGSPKRTLSLTFPHQIPVYASPFAHTCYMPRPPHSSRFYHPNNIEWGVQIIMQFSPLPSFLAPLWPKHSHRHPILKHPQHMSSLNVSNQVSHPHKITGNIIVPYILIFK